MPEMTFITALILLDIAFTIVIGYVIEDKLDKIKEKLNER